jgi:hypothetical protein
LAPGSVGVLQRSTVLTEIAIIQAPVKGDFRVGS